MTSRRVQEIGFSPTLRVADLARGLRADGVDVLDFSAGQPDFPTPEPVKQAGRRAIDENKTRYTANAGIPELREAIVARLHRETDLDYAPEQVLVSPGAKSSLYFALQALVDPGDEVLVPSPYWTSYPEQVRLAGGRPVFVDCPQDNGFKLDAPRLEAATTSKTRALLLNYPSNPTGACYAADELAPLGEICAARGIWIIADEIYSKLLYDGRRFTSIATLGDAIRDRTLIIDGMSKTYAMTGWRLGYAVGPRDVIAAMGKLQSHVTSNATSISQWAAVRALELSDAELAPRLAEFAERRDALLQALEQIPGVRCVRPDGAFYAFPDVSSCFTGTIDSGEALATWLLEQARVAVVPGEAFGSPAHIRVSYATGLDHVRAGAARIVSALTELARG